MNYNIFLEEGKLIMNNNEYVTYLFNMKDKLSNITTQIMDLQNDDYNKNIKIIKSIIIIIRRLEKTKANLSTKDDKTIKNIRIILRRPKIIEIMNTIDQTTIFTPKATSIEAGADAHLIKDIVNNQITPEEVATIAKEAILGQGNSNQITSASIQDEQKDVLNQKTIQSVEANNDNSIPSADAVTAVKTNTLNSDALIPICIDEIPLDILKYINNLTDISAFDDNYYIDDDKYYYKTTTCKFDITSLINDRKHNLTIKKEIDDYCDKNLKLDYEFKTKYEISLFKNYRDQFYHLDNELDNNKNLKMQEIKNILTEFKKKLWFSSQDAQKINNLFSNEKCSEYLWGQKNGWIKSKEYDRISILNKGELLKLVLLILDPESFCFWYNISHINMCQAFKLINIILNIFFIKTYKKINIENTNFTFLTDTCNDAIERDTQIFKSLLIQNLYFFKKKYIENLNVSSKEYPYQYKYISDYIYNQSKKIKENSDQYIFIFKLFTELKLHYQINGDKTTYIKSSDAKNILDMEYFSEIYYYSEIITSRLDDLEKLNTFMSSDTPTLQSLDLPLFNDYFNMSLASPEDITEPIDIKVQLDLVYSDKVMINYNQVLTYVKERNDVSLLYTDTKYKNSDDIKNPRYKLEVILENVKLGTGGDDKDKLIIDATTITSKDLNTPPLNENKIKLNFYNFIINYYNSPFKIGFTDENNKNLDILYYDSNKPVYGVNDNNQNNCNNFNIEKAISDVKDKKMEKYYIGKINKYYGKDISSKAITNDPECGQIILSKLRNLENIIIIGNGQSGAGKTAALVSLSMKDGTKVTVYPGLLPCIAENLTQTNTPSNLQFFDEINVKLINVYWYLNDSLTKIQNVERKYYHPDNIKFEGADDITDFNFKFTSNQSGVFKWHYYSDNDEKPNKLKAIFNDSEYISLEEIIEKAFGIREEEPTKNNPNSSRSHIITCVTFKGKKDNLPVESKLVICDLAGVEDEFKCNFTELLTLEKNYSTLSNKYSEQAIKSGKGTLMNYDNYFCLDEKRYLSTPELTPNTLLDKRTKIIGLSIDSINFYNQLITNPISDPVSEIYERKEKEFIENPMPSYNIKDQIKKHLGLPEELEDALTYEVKDSTFKNKTYGGAYTNNQCNIDNNLNIINAFMKDYKFPEKDAQELLEGGAKFKKDGDNKTDIDCIIEYLISEIEILKNFNKDCYLQQITFDSDLTNTFIKDVEETSAYSNTFVFNNFIDQTCNTHISSIIDNYDKTKKEKELNITTISSKLTAFIETTTTKYGQDISGSQSKKYNDEQTSTTKWDNMTKEVLALQLNEKTNIQNENIRLQAELGDDGKEIERLQTSISGDLNTINTNVENIQKIEYASKYLPSPSFYATPIQPTPRDANTRFYIGNMQTGNIKVLSKSWTTFFYNVMITDATIEGNLTILRNYLNSEYITNDDQNTLISYLKSDTGNFYKVYKENKQPIDAKYKNTTLIDKINKIAAKVKMIKDKYGNQKGINDTEIASLKAKNIQLHKQIEDNTTAKNALEAKNQPINDKIKKNKAIITLIESSTSTIDIGSTSDNIFTEETVLKYSTNQIDSFFNQKKELEFIEIEKVFKKDTQLLDDVFNKATTDRTNKDSTEIALIKTNIETLISDTITTLKVELKKFNDKMIISFIKKKYEVATQLKLKYFEKYRKQDIEKIAELTRKMIKLSQLEFNCTIRRQEGYMINTSLFNMQKFIGGLLFNSAKKRFNRNLIDNELIPMSNNDIFIKSDFIKFYSQIIKDIDNFLQLLCESITIINIEELRKSQQISFEEYYRLFKKFKLIGLKVKESEARNNFKTPIEFSINEYNTINTKLSENYLKIMKSIFYYFDNLKYKMNIDLENNMEKGYNMNYNFSLVLIYICFIDLIIIYLEQKTENIINFSNIRLKITDIYNNPEYSKYIEEIYTTFEDTENREKYYDNDKTPTQLTNTASPIIIHFINKMFTLNKVEEDIAYNLNILKIIINYSHNKNNKKIVYFHNQMLEYINASLSGDEEPPQYWFNCKDFKDESDDQKGFSSVHIKTSILPNNRDGNTTENQLLHETIPFNLENIGELSKFYYYITKSWKILKKYTDNKIKQYNTDVVKEIDSNDTFPTPLLYTSPSFDSCIEGKYKYDNEYNKFYNKNDKGKNELEILFDIMKTDSKTKVTNTNINGFNIDMSKSTIVLFTVINLTPSFDKPINNPPTPPFININKLKLIYKILNLQINKQLFHEVILKNKTVNCWVSIYDNIKKYGQKFYDYLMTYQFYQKISSEFEYLKTDNIFAINTETNNFFIKKSIDLIESNNATTLIGTVDFDRFTKIRDPNEVYFICDGKVDNLLKQLDLIEELSTQVDTIFKDANSEIIIDAVAKSKDSDAKNDVAESKDEESKGEESKGEKGEDDNAEGEDDNAESKSHK